MPTRVIYPEWRDANRSTRYPFADSASLANATGGFLADDVFLDLALYPLGALERMYLSSVVIDAATISVYFGDETETQRCVGVFDLADPPSHVPLVDVYGRSAGLIVSQPELLAQLQALGLGTHDFTAEATEICAMCVTPLPETGVRGFLLDDGSVIDGDAWLVAAEGLVFSYEPAEVPTACGGSTTEMVIRLDAVGDPLFRRLLCEPLSLFTSPRFLKELRIMQNCELKAVVTPDEFGNVQFIVGNTLASDTVLRIRPTEQGLQIETIGADR